MSPKPKSRLSFSLVALFVLAAMCSIVVSCKKPWWDDGPKHRLDGTVTETVSGQPIEGMLVYIGRGFPVLDPQAALASAVSDAEGRYTILFPAPEENAVYSLGFRKEHYPATTENFDPNPPTQELRRSFDLLGYVRLHVPALPPWIERAEVFSNIFNTHRINKYMGDTVVVKVGNSGINGILRLITTDRYDRHSVRLDSAIQIPARDTLDLWFKYEW